METLHPALKRGLSIWDRERLPREEFEKRLTAIRKQMTVHNTDLLLVYGDSYRYGNLAYVSHYLPKNRGALALVPAERDPALIVKEPSRNLPFSSTITWMKEVASLSRYDKGLQDFLKKRGLSPRTVGLACLTEQLGAGEVKALRQVVPGARFQEWTHLLDPLRLVKTERELALIREASTLAEQAALAFHKECRAGNKEYQAAAAAERVARLGGAEDVRILLARGSEPEIGLRPPDGSPFSSGDTVLLYVSVAYQRYWSEVGQTFYLGNPPAEIRSAHERLKEIHGRLVQELGPGKPISNTVSQIDDPTLLSRQLSASLRTYGFGNGLGLDPDEAPILVETNSSTLQEGMILTVRLCAHGPGLSSALLARPYQATREGLQPLISLAPEITVC
ncbi:MAG: aminopeptidase P family protein [Candidatus Tectomicrobia bacterium]|uniref:Aminopeptidase P family protein n=1 Tax=Tectimicrobiota bacterium TaxID=2528274 RepID=A0A932GR53_UNCTE|nr:aminopeptidase P family protein [Candidatus Tectomicrobia bacterium]